MGERGGVAALIRVRRRIRIRICIAMALAVASVCIIGVFAAAALPLAASSSPVAASASGPQTTEATVTASSSVGCAPCHAEQYDALESSAHAGLSCLRCHGAHGEGDPRPARERAPQVCYDCHPDFGVTQHFHIADGTVPDPLAGKPLTCTSTCHDPHGTTHKMMLRRPYEEGESGSDDLCLACHDGVGTEY